MRRLASCRGSSQRCPILRNLPIYSWKCVIIKHRVCLQLIIQLFLIFENRFIVLQHDLFPETVDLAIGYTLQAALNNNPPFTVCGSLRWAPFRRWSFHSSNLSDNVPRSRQQISTGKVIRTKPSRKIILHQIRSLTDVDRRQIYERYPRRCRRNQWFGWWYYQLSFIIRFSANFWYSACCRS